LVKNAITASTSLFLVFDVLRNLKIKQIIRILVSPKLLKSRLSDYWLKVSLLLFDDDEFFLFFSFSVHFLVQSQYSCPAIIPVSLFVEQIDFHFLILARVVLFFAL
jgi:hypothetical protein